MGYKRAEWHSGLTYKQLCKTCNTNVTYQDNALGFRPWYADGFVYCPNCKTPLRHNEDYAIDKPAAPREMTIPAPTTVETPTQPAEEITQPVVEDSQKAVATADEAPVFCTQCGKKFSDVDIFCSGCGTKRQ
ncbi:MAG: hypothetical protein IJC86_02425 [Clostridia bacterium]|nr:hypothetical protein [Clostridia bacterium]